MNNLKIVAGLLIVSFFISCAETPKEAEETSTEATPITPESSNSNSNSLNCTNKIIRRPGQSQGLLYNHRRN